MDRGSGMLGTLKERVLREDPITNRMISDSCWNGHHEEDGEKGDYCGAGCKCMCHDGSASD